VPAKQEQSTPPRADTHRMETSRFPAPSLKTIARERDSGSPITRAVTGASCLLMGSEEAAPQDRLMHDTSDSCM